jgi:transposase-like protein
MESEELGANAAAVCRRHEIATSMLFRWRAQFGLSKDKTVLSTVAAAGTKEADAGERACEGIGVFAWAVIL